MAEDFSDRDKDYGLPQVDLQPIKRDQPPVAHVPNVPVHPKEKKDNKLIVIVLSVVGALILASLLYLIFNGDEPTRDLTIPTSVEDRATPETDETVEAAGDLEESEGAETLVIEEEPGTITTISQRTNRYYIFVGSYKFRAYASRHAEKLADDGFAVKLITPDNWVGVRVAVGNYANSEEAQADAQEIRSRYGTEVVISKY
jgi:flagellar basal body-associated protein FliL